MHFRHRPFHSAQFASALLALLLTACGGGGGSSSAPQGSNAEVVVPAPPVTPPAFAEVPAAPRDVLLLVGPEQAVANTVQIEAYARSLASDLNGRTGVLGPHWTVRAVQAAATAKDVREQLKGAAGAILIGNVPVPSVDGVTPMMDPLRVPNCTGHTFDATGTRLLSHPAFILSDPQCRNGITISVLRGRTAATQVSDVAHKLTQFIQYHDSSNSANATWTPGYDFVMAAWVAGYPFPMDQEYYWSTVPLLKADQIRYVLTGSGRDRRDAFLRCATGAQEMCSLNAHGTASDLVFEGPGVYGETYSTDSVGFNASGFSANPVNAKFINLQSCSSQNFLQENSIASTMLMSGRNLLTLGFTEVTVVSNSVEGSTIAKVYTHLQQGASYADAFAGSMDSTPWSFQGDPYISARPVPTGSLPMLVIDGKHYNEGVGIVRVGMPDSVGGAKSVRNITITNPGKAVLKFKVNIFPFGTGINAKVPNYTPNGGAGFAMDAPAVVTRSGGVDLGNVELTVAPGASQVLSYSMAPIGFTTGTAQYGDYNARYEIVSNDPAAFHIYLEFTGKVRQN